MAIEYRRMLLFGPEMGRFEVLGEDHARRLEAPPAAGVGAVGDERADNGQYIERRVDGGPWVAWSYFAGAADFWFRARLMAIEQIENDVRRLRQRAQAIADAAGADVQGCKNAIAAAEGDLKVALVREKEQRAIARDLRGQVEKVEAQLAPLRRELDKAPPAPVEAPVG